MTTNNPNVKTALQVGEVVANRLKARMADPRAVWGYPWPFPGLNKVTGGIHPPELTILTARPSVGKTTIMVQCADSVVDWLKSSDGAQEAPDGVVRLVLCESTAEVFFRRWACLRAGVSYTRIQPGRVKPAKAERFIEELRGLARFAAIEEDLLVAAEVLEV
jgi:replicative DNA helicase